MQICFHREAYDQVTIAPAANREVGIGQLSGVPGAWTFSDVWEFVVRICRGQHPVFRLCQF